MAMQVQKQIQPKVIKLHLQTDKGIAAQVRDAAREELQSGYTEPVPMDITGQPSELHTFRQYKQQQQAALLEVRSDLFRRKIEVDVCAANGSREKRRYLISKGRYTSGLGSDDWMILSWTAPITKHIRDADIGSVVEWEKPRTGAIDRITIQARGHYEGTLLPKITESTYFIGQESIYVADESAFLDGEKARSEAPVEKPEKRYEAAENFGLHEIIEEADPTQWQALHLPFRETVLVEGPPGSGKTSIGLMRVPCLIDQQWEEFGLDPRVDAPLHDVSTMRVLVMNDEMIDYLAKLIQSVSVRGLAVQTMGDFCRQICRRGGTLSGRTVNESQLLTALKHHPVAFRTVWSGLKRSVDAHWANGASEYFQRFRSVAPELAPALITRLSGWKDRLIKASDPGLSAQPPNLAETLQRWQASVEQRDTDVDGRSQIASAAREQLNALKEEVKRFGTAIFDRRRLFESMRETDEFAELLDATGISSRDVALREWQEQTEGDVQHISNGDLLLHARLASYVTLLRGKGSSPPVGGRMPDLTHVVIDEAQDVAVDHVRLIRKLLHSDGTLTLVGDLRQRVSHEGYFSHWTDLELDSCKRTVFAVNHRQSRPLGEFVGELHRCLFGSPPEWRPSERRNAPMPRVRPKRGFAGLADVVAEEVRHWRHEIPGATVGIVYHGQRWNRAIHFAERIEEAIGDTLTEVKVASSRESGNLNRIDCAIIASVEVTKGLEFDAVVFIDRHQDWTGSIGKVPEIRRNGLYVAASRAKQGLSLIIDDRCELLQHALNTELFESISVVSGRGDEEDDDIVADDVDDEQ